MSIKKIDELDQPTLAAILANIEEYVLPIKDNGSTDEAVGAFLAQLIIVTYSSSVAYAVGRRIEFEGQIFKVLTLTTAGQTPHTHRTKFKYIGGGINASNIGANNTGALTATYNKTSGIVTFSGLTPIAPGDTATLTITNTTVSSNTDVECYVTGAGDGYAAIANKAITGNTISLSVTNTNTGDNLFEFSVWFNNRA